MKIFRYILLAFFLLGSITLKYSGNQAWADIDDEVDIHDLLSDKRYYELVNKRFKPESDEFYLDSIYASDDKAWANISRSKEMRASDLHRNAISYTIGSPINDYLVIEDINIAKKQVLLRDIRTDKHFQLRMSYGSAKSRLIPLIDKD